MFAGKGKPTRCGSSNFHTPDERYENPVAKNCMNLKRVDAKQGVYYETVFDNFVIGAEERAEACENLYNMYSKRAANLREDQIKKMDDDNAKGDDEVPF